MLRFSVRKRQISNLLKNLLFVREKCIKLKNLFAIKILFCVIVEKPYICDIRCLKSCQLRDFWSNLEFFVDIVLAEVQFHFF